MNVLSLFSGIGGLDLGLERAGMTVVGQVEISEARRAVLAHHWPATPRHDDVRTAPDWWMSEERPRVDVVAGGVPCQPFSRAGAQLGIGDQRWGWPWMADVVRVARPRFVIVENVAALLADSDAFGWILRDLADLGMDAEWGVLSACTVGAPHTRDRLFLVAYTDGVDGAPRLGLGGCVCPVPAGDGEAGPWTDPIERAVEAQHRPDGVADGVAVRMVAAGGDAVVPQVAEHIGRLVMGAAA